MKIHRHRKAKLLFQDHKAWGRKMSLFKNTVISKLQCTLNHPKGLTKITGNHVLLSGLEDFAHLTGSQIMMKGTQALRTTALGYTLSSMLHNLNCTWKQMFLSQRLTGSILKHVEHTRFAYQCNIRNLCGN